MQGLRYSVESHAVAYSRMHPAKLQRGFHAPTFQRMHLATLQRAFHAPACQRMHQPRHSVPSTPRRARELLGSSCTRQFSTRNHPGITLVHRRQYPPNLDHMICHKRDTKTILQSIPIHPKSRNKPNFHIHTISTYHILCSCSCFIPIPYGISYTCTV